MEPETRCRGQLRGRRNDGTVGRLRRTDEKIELLRPRIGVKLPRRKEKCAVIKQIAIKHTPFEKQQKSPYCPKKTKKYVPIRD